MSIPSPPEPGKPSLPPSLPIVALEPWEQRSNLEKYGGFHYLAIGGLVLLVGMILWFAWGVWSLRAVWQDVYILHDPARSEVDRVNAADRLARNPDATPKQRLEIALRRDLPDLARSLVAESLGPDVAASSPRSYALSVARSEGWPDWLRLLLLRPLAYGAGEGDAIEQEPVRELSRHADPLVRLWALYTLAESSRYNRFERDQLRSAARDGPAADLAALLARALDADDDPRRLALLDEATAWSRSHHPGAVALWSGWERTGGGLVHRGEDEGSGPALGGNVKDR